MMDRRDKLIITRVMLKDYIRIGLGEYSVIEFCPDSDYQLQMVLGTNGSGKSSLMHEAWFLPANKDHYLTTGKKEIEGYWKGIHYKLVSDIESNKHYFSVDGIEMNEGGKIERCRELCEQHLKVTNEIRALAMMYEKLVDMSPGRRRYWMVKLADSDFTYAMKVYDKLKSAHRDASGAIKRLQKRHVDESLKLADKEVVKELTADTHSIKKLIDEIYSMRNGAAKKSVEWVKELEQNADQLAKFSNDIDRLTLTTLQESGYNNTQEMVARKATIKLEIFSTQQLSQHLYADHERIRKKYDVLIKAGSESIIQLETKQQAAQDSNTYERSFLAMPQVTITSDPQQMSIAFESVYHDLFEKISALPTNDDLYSRVEADKQEQIVTELIPKMNELQARIMRLNGDIEHRSNHVNKESITCPKCKHNWTTIASDEDIEKAKNKIAEMKEKLHEWEIQLKASREYLKEYSEYAEKYRAVIMTIKSVPIMTPYFSEITQKNRLIHYPATVAADLHTVASDLARHVTIFKNNAVIAEVLNQINLKKNLDADTLESIELDLENIVTTMNVQTAKLAALNDELTQLDLLISQDFKASILHDDMLRAHDVQKSLVNKFVYSKYQELLWNMILALQTQLARKEDALAYINSQQQVVDDIVAQIAETEMNERVAKAAHMALSPTTGAIAEGLNRFINSFVPRLNKIINSIWTYPLMILPFVTTSSGEMDYKFPYRVKDAAKPNKDVDEGSESMINMFNMSFMMSALRQLGLGHLPLFLDEFESAYDDAHRSQSTYFIKQLIEEGAYGQVFMISHYESNHGALSSMSQTCILSRDNLMLASNVEANQHVTFS